MPEMKLNDAVVNYEVTGTGPALVFAHGAGGNRLSWWQQVPAFMERYTCITFSHPGFESSRWINGAEERTEYSEILSDLLDRLEVETVALVGQSMGGWTCLPLAVKQPGRVKALFMASTPGNLRSPEIDGIREANSARLSGLRQAWDEHRPGSFNPAVGERCLNEQPELHYLYSVIQSLNPPRSFNPRVAFGPEDMRGYATPTMYVTGEEDVVLPPELIDAAAAMTPGAGLERVEKTGHSVYFERPETFNSLLDGFLSDVYPA